MSDKIRDTSRPTTKVIKNPLLNTGITGLTFSDIAQNAILFPPTAPVTETISTEATKSVIFSPQADSGLAPTLDTENFSEISLEDQQNTDSGLSSSNQQLNTSFYNPLLDLDSAPAQLQLNQDEFNQKEEAETNFNRFPTTADLTASFSQLPAVASTVFSTFSNIIKGNAPGASDHHADHQHPPQVQQQAPPPPSNCPKSTLDELYEYQNLNQNDNNLSFSAAPPVAPTFFSPTDPTIAPLLNPSVPVAGNTYRLGGNTKKKYAHIPGLSSRSSPQVAEAATNLNQAGIPPLPPVISPAFNLPPQPVAQYPEPVPANLFESSNVQSQQPPPTESVSSNKFSLFELIPSQILDKIPKPNLSNFIPSSKKVETENQYDNSSGFSHFEINTVAQPSAPPLPQSQPELLPINPNLFNTSPITFNQGNSNTSAIPSTAAESSPASFFQAPVDVKPPPFFQPNNAQAPIANYPPPAAEPTTFYQPTTETVAPNLPPSNPSAFFQPTVGAAPTSAPTSAFFQPTSEPTSSCFPPPPAQSNPSALFQSTEPAENLVPPTFFTPSDVPTVPKTTEVVAGSNPYSRAKVGRGLTAYKNPLLPVANTSPIFLPNPTPPPATNYGNIFTPASQETSVSPSLPPAQNQIFGASPPPPPLGQSVGPAIATSVSQPTLPVSVFNQANPAEEPAKPPPPAATFFTPTVAAPANNLNNFFAPPPPLSSENNIQSAPFNNQNQFGSVPGSQSPAVNFFAAPPKTSTPTPSPNILQQPAVFQPTNNLLQEQPAIFTPTFSPAVDSFVNQEPVVSGNISQASNLFRDISKNPTPSITPTFVTQGNIFNPAQSPSAPPAAVDSLTKTNSSLASSLFEEEILSNPRQSASPLTSYFQVDTKPDFFTNSFNNSSVQLEQKLDNFFNSGQQIQAFEGTPDIVPTNNLGIAENRAEAPKQPEVSEPDIVPQLNVFNLIKKESPDGSLNPVNLFNISTDAIANESAGQNQTTISSFNYFHQQSVEDNQDQSIFTNTGDRDIPDTASTGELDEEYINLIKSLEMNSPTSTAAPVAPTNVVYRPVYRHWFYKKVIDTKVIWTPFSMTDSLMLEEASEKPDVTIIPTDGGRFDVNIKLRSRTPVYWTADANEVRRCSWFYKGIDSRYVPYEEDVAALLEDEYREASTNGNWNRRLELPNGEKVVFHGASVMVHFLNSQGAPDAWGSNASQATNRPRVVKRGVDEFNIDDGEPEKVDHLLFMVHGIGKFCDLKFRPVEEVVDEFRSIAMQLVQSHYRTSVDKGEVGRVEVLPVSWHSDLHSDETGIDEKLKAITLESIPKLRSFTNDTLLDILFYTSPIYCQSIMDAVGGSLNRYYSLFCQRNPSFTGCVSLGGHSLGTLILFDLLCHQSNGMEKENVENPNDDLATPLPKINIPRPLKRTCSKQINYTIGIAGTGQPFINYPQLLFSPKKFFAMGSPIGMFVTVRGIDKLGLDFKLPTCEGFYNIFHPYDPVAYRCESLVNPELSGLRPVLIPHHKGRKRMHLELRETMVRVGADLKQKLFDTFRNTLDAVYSLASISKPDPQAIESEVDKVLEQQLNLDGGRGRANSTSTQSNCSEMDGETDLPLGQLNNSKRIDYVLQEAPLEFFNEYLFALTSHVCYWESEDTLLFIMKEIYTSMGIQTDSQIPQHTMTIERPSPSLTPNTDLESPGTSRKR